LNSALFSALVASKSWMLPRKGWDFSRSSCKYEFVEFTFFY